jgi:hypothetical protein
LTFQKGPTQTSQHPLENSYRWLESELTKKVGSQLALDAALYALQALKLGARNVEGLAPNVLSTLENELNVKLTALVDLPQKDPEAVLYLYRLARDYKPALAREFSKSILDDAKRVQLPDGSILGNHVAMSLLTLEFDKQDPAVQLALNHTVSLFDQKVVQQLDRTPIHEIYLYVKTMFDGGQITAEKADRVTKELVSKQEPDGGWGEAENTIYAVRTLILLDTLTTGDSVQRAMNHLKDRLDKNGTLKQDLRLTSLVLIGWQEVAQAYSKTQDIFDATGVMANASGLSLEKVITAAIKRAQSRIVAVNLESRALAQAIENALKASPSLSVALIHPAQAKLPALESLKQGTNRVVFKPSSTEFPPMLIIDNKLVIYVILKDDVLRSENAFSVNIYNPELAQKIVSRLL